MGKVVEIDKEGRIIYEGLLSSQEKADIDDIIYTLKTEIPQIEMVLEKEYGKTVLYKYYLGKFLSELLDKYDISHVDRRKFWNEIKKLASTENRKRNEGKESVTRSFYEQCYVLSEYDENIVKKMSWRQWQDMLDRVSNRQDSRIFDWIGKLENKMREDDWREFEKALHLFLKNKDTSVFSEDEVFDIYNSIYEMCKYWRIKFDAFTKQNPKSAKIKTKSKRSKKFYDECFKMKKETRQKLSNAIFDIAFEKAMK